MPIHVSETLEASIEAGDVKGQTRDEEKQDAGLDAPETDRAIVQFSEGSLYAITNQYGVSKPFLEDPSVAHKTSSFAVPDALRSTKHPVQDFWVYDGAHATLAAQGKIATSRDQILPVNSLTEQQAIEWQRIGSKKGWMFNGSPQQEGGGGPGEDKATHSIGYPKRIKETRWHAEQRSIEKQELATRQLPAIDIENNARGIGTTGASSGNGGMAGGYKEVQKERLNALPIPMEKFNWTGNRVRGTGREDQGVGSGAGGYRAGYVSAYPDRPAFVKRSSVGLSRLT